MLSHKAIDDFKSIYKQEFGESISNQEAKEKGEKLLRLFSIIYKPIPKNWIKRVLKEESIKR
jgi:hypothetical protein